MNRQLDTALEVKRLTENGEFAGYGSVFDVIDSYADVIAKGAFTTTLSKWAERGRYPSLLWQHDQSQPIGTYTAMREDDRGLYVEGKLALKTRQGAEAYELLQIGAITGLSIGFITVDQEFNSNSDVRVIKEVDLWEVSLVTFPANDAARIGAVKAALRSGEVPSLKEFERFLRDAGFSRTQAKAIIADGYKGLGNPRDVEDQAPVIDTLKSLIQQIA